MGDVQNKLEIPIHRLRQTSDDFSETNTQSFHYLVFWRSYPIFHIIFFHKQDKEHRQHTQQRAAIVYPKQLQRQSVRWLLKSHVFKRYFVLVIRRLPSVWLEQ